jgi:hypothetical protein
MGSVAGLAEQEEVAGIVFQVGVYVALGALQTLGN